jgi:hypothetical protein
MVGPSEESTGRRPLPTARVQVHSRSTQFNGQTPAQSMNGSEAARRSSICRTACRPSFDP